MVLGNVYQEFVIAHNVVEPTPTPPRRGIMVRSVILFTTTL